jgi:hypothetical protein
MKILCHLSLGVVILHGCAGFQRTTLQPVHTIFALDATASVVPTSLAQAVKAVESEIDRMQRGDCITVLPIISNSVAIPSDEIVRGCAPTARQPYDQDLKVFRDQLRKNIDLEAQKLSSAQAEKTDILGTIDLLDQELSLDGPKVQKRVVLFSDFIEEDDTRNFIRSVDVSDVAVASTLARDLAYRKKAAGNNAATWDGVEVLLAGLQSSELPQLAESRRAAIQQFWMEYFDARQAQPRYVNDGPGICGRFLAR